MDNMGNYQIKKREAERFNKARREAEEEKLRIAEDKKNNPEKYRRRRRPTRKASTMLTIAGAMSLSAALLDQKIE